MYFITTKRMLEVCFSAHPNIQYRTEKKFITKQAAGKGEMFRGGSSPFLCKKLDRICCRR
ncbi:MAG: hypothetical protein E7K27_21945 [[Clostridium] symbiosum]|nr:hypothetical protein [[Clostridium] symbiosum]